MAFPGFSVETAVAMQSRCSRFAVGIKGDRSQTVITKTLNTEEARATVADDGGKRQPVKIYSVDR